MTRSLSSDLEVFESHRALLVAHAYRMLGDLGRAEDMVQEAWLRWDGRREEVDSTACVFGDDRYAVVLQRTRFSEGAP